MVDDMDDMLLQLVANMTFIDLELATPYFERDVQSENNTFYVSIEIASKRAFMTTQSGLKVNGKEDRSRQRFLTYAFAGPIPAIRNPIDDEAFMSLWNRIWFAEP